MPTSRLRIAVASVGLIFVSNHDESGARVSHAIPRSLAGMRKVIPWLAGDGNVVRLHQLFKHAFATLRDWWRVVSIAPCYGRDRESLALEIYLRVLRLVLLGFKPSRNGQRKNKECAGMDWSASSWGYCVYSIVSSK